MREVSDATNWTADDLDAALDACDCLVEATFWGVSVDFSASDIGAETEGQYVSYLVAVYPLTDPEGYYGAVQSTADACLAECRSLLREYAGAEWETWVLHSAIASGLQPALFAVAS